jgi:hypothetical protein
MATGLFGINKSNRNLTLEKNWGKNVFNSTFPASLACYMHSRKINPVYLVLDNKLHVQHSEISIADLFRIDPLGEQTYFGFEMQYAPYQALAVNSILRIDLVVMKKVDDLTEPISPLEIKLTALPDESTHRRKADGYGCELVIRPSTILYMALSIALNFRKDPTVLLPYLSTLHKIKGDWGDERDVFPYIESACDSIDAIAKKLIRSQSPILMQPIWKTDGKSSVLHEDCLDIFVWSDIAFTRLFVDSVRADIATGSNKMTRQMRTVLWLAKMLFDFAVTGQIDFVSVFEDLTYNTKPDKSFSVNGLQTWKYMKGAVLLTPRIKKGEIKNIILGGGEKFLSPERRFDAVIVNTPGLFN